MGGGEKRDDGGWDWEVLGEEWFIEREERKGGMKEEMPQWWEWKGR